MTWQFFSVLPIWLLGIAGAIVIAFTAPAGGQVTWLAIVLAICITATFAIQLAIQRKDGFVVRAMASIGGSVLLLAIATGVFALIG